MASKIIDQVEQMDGWQQRLAASTTLYQAGSLREALVRLAAAGLRWVEIADDFGDPRHGAEAATIRRLVAETGLRVHSLHLPMARLMIGHPKPALREQSRAVLEASLELAAELEAGVAVLHVNSDLDGLPDENFEDSRAVSVELVSVLAERARTLGLRLALENLPLEPGERRRFGSTLQELCAVFPDPGLGFCLDTGHALVNRAALRAEIRAAGARLVSVHLSDNDGRGDLHWPPGQGMLDWAGLMRELAGVGYEGRLVLELLRDRTGGPLDAVLQQALDFVSAA